MLLAPWFAVAGLLAAAGVVMIHLLNRRRHRVVEWAAMDFLREALTRNRRLLRLQDLLLLALRMLCIAGFGLALAQPFWGDAAGVPRPDQPVHAVLLIDNSLSMGYQTQRPGLDAAAETLLDEAKSRARALVDGLPRGSRISVVPTCGSPVEPGFAAYHAKEDALEALDAIEPVDRSAAPAETIELARQACRRVSDVPAKQIVLFCDRQVSDWPAESFEEYRRRLPAPLQIVQVDPGEVDNAWIADVKLLDGVADLQTPAVFVATIRYEGPSPRRDVPVTLTVDGGVVAVHRVRLQPGQKREIQFPPYRLDVSVQPGQVANATVEVSMPPDRLPADDRRLLVAPVVAALPVVFVDQLGEKEDPRQNRYGETFHLRRLLAPVTGRMEGDRRFVEVRHKRIDQVDRALLQDARLVVIAGVSSPQQAVPQLRRYVEQGGHLVIAAGGRFDPALWTEKAWLDGLGILPVPLEPTPVGRLPEEATDRLQPFQLDFDGMIHDEFLLEGASREELRDLYALPYFFKAVAADVGDEVARRTKPMVLARYTNGLPFMVRCRWGRGQVLLVTTGVSTGWTTLPLTNTFLIFDRILRGMLHETLPRRNIGSRERLVLPVAAAERSARFTLTGPDGREEPLSVDAQGPDRFALTIGNRTRRGQYRVTAVRAGQQQRAGAESRLWEIPLAVNGPSEESQLLSRKEIQLREARRPAGSSETAPAASVGWRATSPRGKGLWKWVMLAVLGCLILELTVLAWSSPGEEGTA